MNRSEEEIEAIYAALPALECKGLCQESCGPILASEAEMKRIGIRAGQFPRPGKDATCSALKDGKCSIYKIRPYICRIWGAEESMKCPWGCKPKKYLTKQESYAFLDQLDLIK